MCRTPALIAFFLVACGDPSTRIGDFSFELVDYAPHEGQPVTYSLRDEEGVEVASGADTVNGGTVRFAVPAATASTESYDLYFFVDFDRDGRCTAPPADHVWALTHLDPTDEGDLTVSYAHTVDFTAACEFFTP